MQSNQNEKQDRKLQSLDVYLKEIALSSAGFVTTRQEHFLLISMHGTER